MLKQSYPTVMRSLIVVLALSPCWAPSALMAQTKQKPAILFDKSERQTVPLPDYSYAGYNFGVSSSKFEAGTVIDVTRFGAVANDDLDDSKAILQALQKAHQTSGAVTLSFPPGRFIVSEVILIERSHITVAGAGRGAGGTELYFPRPLRMVDKSDRLNELRQYLRDNEKRQVEPLNNLDEPFSEYSWTGGFLWTQAPIATTQKPQLIAANAGKQFQFTVKLARTGAYQVGDVISLQWYAPNGKQSALLKSLYGAMADQAGARHFEDPERAIVVQTTRVLAVSGQQIQIASPLMHDISADQPARTLLWQGLSEVAIKDLHFAFAPGTSFGHHLEQGWNAIHLGDVFNGRIESLRISNADSAILTYDSASVTINDIHTTGKRVAHYAVHFGSIHNGLASNLQIDNPVVHALSFNTQSTRCVYQHAHVRQQPVLDQHAGANHQNLFDQITVHVRPILQDGRWSYPLWNGSGASYWQPGHGRFNTTWNLHVLVDAGPDANASVNLTGLEEGPDARLIGIYGNRNYKISYLPKPYLDLLNTEPAQVPSLYAWQRAQRLAK
jgi:Pectate lyase superfamily protein